MSVKYNSITREEYASFNQTMNDKLDSLTEDVKDISVGVAKLPEQLADKFDERYASKKTEETVDKVMWLVVSAVVLAGLALIFK